MNRARLLSAARLTMLTVLTTGGLLAAAAPASAQQVPEMRQVLAGKKFTPPIRGEAQIQLMAPVTRREKDQVITRIVVKNVSAGPIARLTVNETWYDKAGVVVAGGRGVIAGLLQPDEVQTVIIQTAYSARMISNNWNFSHVNGTVVPKRVPKIEIPKPEAPAAAPTPAK